MNYEEIKENLIKKGADPKLFDMPAIRERLEKISISPEEIVVNSDGTFNFGNYIIGKTTIEQEVEEPVIVKYPGPPYALEDVTYQTEHETKKIQREVLTIVEHFEIEEEIYHGLDAPFHLSEDYDPRHKYTVAELTIVDEDGFEEEKQVIDKDLFVNEQLQNGSLSYRTFEERADLVSKRLTRSNGIITEEKEGHKWESYDIGSWDLRRRATFGTREGESPVAVIRACEGNEQRLAKKYPHLQSSIEKRKHELMHQVDARTLAFHAESINLRGQNDRLQKMLQKSLAFAQTVRDSRVGKLFFGKKAKEVLAEQDKDAKQLPEGR